MSKKHFNKGGQAKEVKEYDEEVIEIRRVTRVVKGGRRLRFRATVVIGNRKGKVGIGVGKSQEVQGAIQKAISQAKKEVATVTLNDHTIPHELKIKHKGARIIMIPASPGTGLIAGGTVRKVLELAGVKNILSKTIGSSNKINNTYATFKALTSFSETPWMIAAAKGKAAAAVPKPEIAEKEVLKSETSTPKKVTTKKLVKKETNPEKK